MDPLKVLSIKEIPPPRNLHQLQSLQGKANFDVTLSQTMPLRGMVCSTSCVMISLQWDEHAKTLFDDLKSSLSNYPLFSPPDYDHDCILYLSASTISVAGVLIQLGDDGREHVIYYLSKNILGAPLEYNHD
jgi:hypothetical protein